MDLKALMEAAAKAAEVLTNATAQLAKAEGAEEVDKKQVATLKKAVTAANREKTKADKAVDAAKKKAEREEAKAKKAAEREEAKAKKAAEREAAKAAKAAEKEANKMPSQNGVTRPKPTTACGRIWAVCDDLSAKRKAPTPIEGVKEVCLAEGINIATIKTQYARWRKFHGVNGRIVDAKEAPAKEPAKDAK